MEINNIIDDEKMAEKFISQHFDPTDGSYKNPIFPYKISSKVKNDDITFCATKLVDAWALTQDSRFTFFLMLKNRSDLGSLISGYYGTNLAEYKVEVNDVYNERSTYYWENKNISIFFKKFRNIGKNVKYEDCSLVIIGNMKYQDVIVMPTGYEY